MIITYAECLEWFGSKYNIKKQISEGKLFKLEKGIYSDERYVPEYQIISVKYPKAVFTMESAFYYHGLTDVIPEKYCLMTDRAASKIADKRVIQSFENYDVLYMGADKIGYNGFDLLMYSRERMLLELLRNKNKLSFDYYKEIISNYRQIIHELNIQLIQDMALALPKTRLIMGALELEVM